MYLQPVSNQDNNFNIRQSPSRTTKAYSRAIKNYTEWSNTTLTITGSNKIIVTPRRLYLFLRYIDDSKRKPDGSRYSFSFYEQHASSVVVLYERQKLQFPTRPKLDEPDELDTGEWEHPRDKNVKKFLQKIKLRSDEEDVDDERERVDDVPISSSSASSSHQQQQQIIRDPRIDSIEEHLRIQADSITRTNALLSLYHNDLGERSVQMGEEYNVKYESLQIEIQSLKTMMNYLISIETKNQQMIQKLIGSDSDSDPKSPIVLVQREDEFPTSEQQIVREEVEAEEVNDHPLVDDDEIPKIELMETKELTLQNLYEEYSRGYQNQPSLKSMELKFKTRWRINGKNNKTILRRLKVGQAIENASQSSGQPVEEIIKELDNYLSNVGKKKKSTYWLSENLPLRFINR